MPKGFIRRRCHRHWARIAGAAIGHAIQLMQRRMEGPSSIGPWPSRNSRYCTLRPAPCPRQLRTAASPASGVAPPMRRRCDHARIVHVALAAITTRSAPPASARALPVGRARSARTVVPDPQRRTLAPPQRRAGGQIGLEGGRARVQHIEHEQSTVSGPTALAAACRACATLHFRLDAALDHIQERGSPPPTAWVVPLSSSARSIHAV